MFLRKLMVILLPLICLGILLALSGWLPGLGFWGTAALGFLSGLAVAVFPMAAGEARGHVPFRRLLLVPALLLAALLIAQALAVRGTATGLPGFLAAVNTTQVLLEAAFAGGLAGTALLG